VQLNLTRALTAEIATNRMAAPTKWIHISEPPGDPWILPVWSEVRLAVERRAVPATRHEMKELGVHISTRLNLVPHVWSRVAHRATALIDEVQGLAGAEHIFTPDGEGFGLAMPMAPLYEFIIDMDAALFETQACAELMRNFLSRALVHTRNPRPRSLKQRFQEIIEGGGADAWWCEALEEARGFFSHQGTVYVAVDVSGDDVDLLLMRENIKRFGDLAHYHRYSEIANIRAGFDASKPAIQAYLCELYRAVDSVGYAG
jgi:hypothetical protein